MSGVLGVVAVSVSSFAGGVIAMKFGLAEGLLVAVLGFFVSIYGMALKSKR